MALSMINLVGSVLDMSVYLPACRLLTPFDSDIYAALCGSIYYGLSFCLGDLSNQ